MTLTRRIAAEVHAGDHEIVIDPHRRRTAVGPRARQLRAGRSVGFGLDHVRDVASPSPLSAGSVHAYSPPLTAMSYYAPDADAALPRLRRTRSVLIEAGSSEGIG